MERIENSNFFDTWVHTLDPVSIPEEDLFNHNSIASQYIDRLTSAPPNQKPSLGLVGPFGAGKSSIINLMKQYATSTKKRVVFARVSPWGLTDGEASVLLILKSIVNEMSLHVDCFSIQGIPDQVNAFIRAIPSSKFATLALSNKPTPDQSLQRLTNILTASGIILVVAIEDADRNRELAKFGPKIEALLSKLRNCTNLAVVLATSPPESAHVFDLAKLCTFEVRVDTVEPYFVNRFLTQLWSLMALPNEMADVKELQHGSSGSSEETASDLSPRLVFDFNRAILEEKTLEDAIKSITTTPRALKRTARHALYVWEDLKGEVDPNHVFLGALIRSNLHATWKWILTNEYLLLRGTARERSWNKQKDLNEVKESMLKAFDIDGIPEWAVTKLLAELFTDAPQTLFQSTFARSLQGFSAGDGRYWKRFLRAGLDFGEQEDQPVLTEIRNANETGDAGGLASRCIANRDYFSRLQHFSECLDPRMRQVLASAVLERTRSTAFVEHASSFNVAASVKLALSTCDDEEQRKWCVSEIPLSCSYHLGHLNDLLHSISKYRNDPKADFGQLVAESLHKICKQEGEGLKKFLAGSNIWLLRVLAQFISHAAMSKQAMRELGKALELCVRSDRDTIGFLVASISIVSNTLDKSYTANDGQPTRWAEYKLDEEMVTALFASREGLLNLLREVSLDGLDAPDLKEFAITLIEEDSVVD